MKRAICQSYYYYGYSNDRSPFPPTQESREEAGMNEQKDICPPARRPTSRCKKTKEQTLALPTDRFPSLIDQIIKSLQQICTTIHPSKRFPPTTIL